MDNIIVSPTQRTLKIVKSQDFPQPANRNKNYLYFIYDKMMMVLYQCRYTDPFCVVDELPDNSVLVTNMLYITLSGYMYTYANESVISLGTVEKKNGVIDPDQLAILRQVGTIYFMNAESRYLDMQTRRLELPYQNGSYQLSLGLAKDILIDNNTVIGFNPNTNQFEVLATEIHPDRWLENLYTYRTLNSPSVDFSIEEGFNAIRAKINVSDQYGNGIEIVPGGLYVDVDRLAELKNYNNMVFCFMNYKIIVDSYVNQLRDAVQRVIESVSKETISEEIANTLEDYKPTIFQMFDKYEELSDRIEDLEEEVYISLRGQIEDVKEEIKTYINERGTAWSRFEEDLSEPVYAYDYSGNT